MKGKKVVFTFRGGETDSNLYKKLRDRIAAKYSYGVEPSTCLTDTTIYISAKQAKRFAKQVKHAKSAEEKNRRCSIM